MKEPFAYVLYIERDSDEHLVSVHRSLDEAEAELRAFAANIVLDPSDDEIVDFLCEYGEHARIYACTIKRNTQTSAELTPFARRQAA
jgi:hypothetical protein